MCFYFECDSIKIHSYRSLSFFYYHPLFVYIHSLLTRLSHKSSCKMVLTDLFELTNSISKSSLILEQSIIDF